VSLRSIGKHGAILGISGPNMGGKTSLLRTCALMVIMTQIGSFVPATSARLSLFDGVFTVIQRQLWTDTSRRQSAPSSVSTSLRTSELSALSTVAHLATRKSLVVIDEIGFGMTSQHARALAVAQAVFFVDSVRCLLLFASHLSDAMEAIKAKLGDNCSLKQFVFSSSNDEDEHSRGDRVGDDADQRVTFHFEIKDGIARDSLAIDTAKRAGLPRQIIDSADAAVARHDSTRKSAK
jgi:DNA mismatch repair protein MSH3